MTPDYRDAIGVPYKWLASFPRVQISERHKFYFVHVPKCGGTSFDNMSQLREEYPSPRSGHHGLHFFLKMLGERLPEFRGFTVVRNPWDRLASAYAYLWLNGSGSPREIEVASRYIRPYETFADFVQALNTLPDLMNNIGHILPMRRYCDLRLLAKHPDHRFRVFKLEEIHDNMEALRQHLRLDDLVLRHDRKGTDQPNYQSHGVKVAITPELFSVIRQLYADDIEMFGYQDWSMSQLVYRQGG
jgi:hypothetical protein